MNAAIQIILTFLLNAVWQVALVAGFAFVCDRLLRGVSARYRHAVWLAAFVLCLSLPILSSVTLAKGILVSLPQPARQSFQRVAAAPDTSRPIAPSFERTESAPAPNSTSVRQESGSIVRLDRRLAISLSALFLAFVFYRGVKLLRAWLATRKIIGAAYSREFSGAVSTVIEDCQSVLGIKRVRFLCSSSAVMPITAGVFKPVVILPEQLCLEADEALLTSAIGHELVHVVRRDYLLNLICELLYLPLSFHPAAAWLRRRIKQTRELSCDERVAEKLLRADVYARSLVQLIGSAPLKNRLPATVTIGISDADNLEVRIMSLVRKQKRTGRRTLLLSASALLLLIPCLAAASFAFRLDISSQEPRASETQKTEGKARLDELKAQQRELENRARHEGRNPESMQQIEAAMRALQQDQKLSEPQLKELEKALAEMKASMDEYEKDLPESQDRLAEVTENFARIEKLYDELKAREFGELGELVQDKKKAEELEWWKREKLDKEFEKIKSKEDSEWNEKKQKEEAVWIEKQKWAELEWREKQDRADEKVKMRSPGFEKMRNKEVFDRGREERAELTRAASISMDRAIQIATSAHSGKVLACNLGRDRSGQVFYHVLIISGEGDQSSAMHVWVSAMDGRILRTEKEE